MPSAYNSPLLIRKQADDNASSSRIIFDSSSDNAMSNNTKKHLRLIAHNPVKFGKYQKVDVDFLVQKAHPDDDTDEKYWFY